MRAAIVGLASALLRRLRPSVVTVLKVAGRPVRIRPGKLYVTISGGKAAFGFMRCPCGCGDTIHLRFFGERKPRWTIGSLKGKATVDPSVWRTTGCKSHFVLKDGRIDWCE